MAEGDHIKGWLNDQLLIDHHDSRFTSGRVGLWTKADSITAFGRRCLELSEMTISTPASQGRIGEVVPYFLPLGLLGFGGPIALVGQMERELVGDRKWLTKEQMREAIAVCQSLPGPRAEGGSRHETRLGGKAKSTGIHLVVAYA
jgi:hypothetical protein